MIKKSVHVIGLKTLNISITKIGKKFSRNLWNEFHPNRTKKNETIRLNVNEPTGSGTKDDKNNERDI